MSSSQKRAGKSKRKSRASDDDNRIHCPYPIIDNFVIVEKRDKKREQFAKLENIHEYKGSIFVRGELIEEMENMEDVPDPLDEDDAVEIAITSWRIEFEDYTSPFILVKSASDGPEYALARPNQRYMLIFHGLEMKAKLTGKLYFLLLADPFLKLTEALDYVSILFT